MYNVFNIVTNILLELFLIDSHKYTNRPIIQTNIYKN